MRKKSKNLPIIIGLLALIAAVAAAALLWPDSARLTDDAPSLITTDAPTASPTSTPAVTDVQPTATAMPADMAEATASATDTAMATPTDMAEATDAPAKAYLLVTVGGVVYQPIPLTQEGSYTVTQKATGAENVIHVTEDSVNMESSTCENQDCVDQGVVSLENKNERILANMIVCLPNQVTLELYTPDEMRQLLLSMQEGNAE